MPENMLPPISAARKSGKERFRFDGSDTDFSLLDFWQWSMSGLVDNTIRGILAEFIVARAVGASTNGARDPWATYDLEAPEGVKVEVKSSSYIQSWAQKCFSDIVFSIAPARAWNDETGDYEGEPKRHADVYVFALLAHKERSTIDPMNLNQWKFYVVPTKRLDKEFGDRKTLTLKRLKELKDIYSLVGFDGLGAAITKAHNSNSPVSS